MTLSRLDIHRWNRGERTVVTLAGDIGPATTPLLRAALEQCLLDGVTVIDVDLTTVGSCDAIGLGVFLSASRRAGRVHASLVLRHPCAQITGLLDATGTTASLMAVPAGRMPLPVPAGVASVPPARGPAPPVLKDGIRLRRLTRGQTEDVREDLADLTPAPPRGTAGDGDRGRAAFLRRLTASARRPGFALVVAETTALVGCAFGFPLGPDGAGIRGPDRSLQRVVQRLTARTRCVVLTQVVAQQHAQRRDIARRLQRRLLTDMRSSCGVALLRPADRAGQADFSSWGWQNMGEVIGLPGPGALCVLVLPFPELLPAHG
ncbi:STAS domain-containing protein [Streptomyces sp. t39]|uniref:STAS domain-containing protein n=1 Tax=Streptomyces sp. t39 TaxID=1828156 RepID=UPI0011CE89F5|nr:STAS domain-containing protein [Streptomyces sp. t39]TXS47735.1 anti-sigma factor antagonist [Streptomyces sp. t39]